MGCDTIATWLAWDLDRGGPHPRRELPLGVGRERLVVLCDQVPGRQRLPRRRAHHIGKRRRGKRLLHCPHHPGAGSIDISGEVLDEVLLRKPAESASIREQMRERRCHRPLREERAERLALVEPERCERREIRPPRRRGASTSGSGIEAHAHSSKVATPKRSRDETCGQSGPHSRAGDVIVDDDGQRRIARTCDLNTGDAGSG